MLKAILGLVVSVGIITNTHVEGTRVIDLYYYVQEETQDVKLIKSSSKVKRGSTEEMLLETLGKLLDNNNEDITFIPEKAVVNMVIFFSGELYVDFSKELLNYGGTMWEEGMVNQILSVIFQFQEVEKVTFYIDGKRENLVEGTVINGYTRSEWKERKIFNEKNK